MMGRIGILMAGLLCGSAVMAEPFQATLQWAGRVELASPVSGIIGKVTVRPGERIDTGQLLLELDPRRFQARLATARAREHEAQQHKAEAERELARALELYDRTVLSDHDKQMAEIGAAQADASWQWARAQLTEAQLDLSQSRIHAPFDAVVVAVMANPAEVVVSELSARPLVALAPVDRLLARAHVAAGVFEQLRLDQKVVVDLQGRRLDARVQALTPEPVSGEGDLARYRVDVLFHRPEDMPLRAGGDATIHLQ
jgi:RND family efflux transporter MFP subunit